MVRRVKEEGALPATTFAILGLLSFGESSGYDLAKFAEQSVGNFFSPAKSHIYAELRRLVQLGYADDRHVRQRQRPDKRIYQITPAGERALHQWLESPEIEPDFIKSPFTLKLFFGHLTSRETLAERIKQFREDCKARLDGYREIERQIAGDDELLFPYLTLKSGLAHARASIRWADDVLDLLEKRSSS